MPRKPAPPRLVWRADIDAWVIRWREAGRKREASTGRASRREAEAVFEEWEAARLAGTIRQRGGAGLTIDEALTVYLVDRETQVADPSRLGYAATALLRFWKDKAVADVRRRTTARVIEFEDSGIDNIKRAFATACRAAKITGVTPHTLRHTAITWACHRGLDPLAICGYFGVTMEVLQAVYLHHHPDFLKSVAERKRA